MTDNDISRELAVAIGWSPKQVTQYQHGGYILHKEDGSEGVSKFDYRDWHVAGPIASYYECFPEPTGIYVPCVWSSWCEKPNPHGSGMQETPQKAIALAVIRAFKDK